MTRRPARSRMGSPGRGVRLWVDTRGRVSHFGSPPSCGATSGAISVMMPSPTRRHAVSRPAGRGEEGWRCEGAWWRRVSPEPRPYPAGVPRGAQAVFIRGRRRRLASPSPDGKALIRPGWRIRYRLCTARGFGPVPLVPGPCPSGGIGRRARLRTVWGQPLGCSNPLSGTIEPND